jgi:hypothetical protein
MRADVRALVRVRICACGRVRGRERVLPYEEVDTCAIVRVHE